MADIDPQLVKAIADAVTAALRQRGQSGTASTSSQATPHPPIGICTGDYSQFKDRPDLAGGATPAPPTFKPRAERSEAPDNPSQPSPPPPPGPPPLTGIITAQQLQDAITAAPDGRAAIATDARLTPLANDFVRENPEKVRRVSAPSPGSSSSGGGSSASGQFLYWADGHCPAVQDITAKLGGRLAPVAASAKGHEITRVVGDIAAAVASRRAAGAVLFVPQAGLPTVAANRCPSLRAVVGTCAAGVEAALKDAAANVLIVEYPYTAPGTMRDMVDRFVQGGTTLPAHLQRELAELHRTGR